MRAAAAQGAAMTITQRDATIADAPTLAALFADSFTAAFGHLYAPADLAAFLAGFTLARWTAEIGDPAYGVRVVEQDGGIVGYAKIGPPSLPVVPLGASVELRQLYLLPAAQGTGAGAALMAWTIAEARRRGAGELFLSVYVDNARAKAFYARHGFERVGRYTFMVGTHEDEDDLMRLVL
jgi:GNAT superfamily N-acetyltransferase